MNLYKVTALVEDAWDVEDDHQKRKRVIGYVIAGDGVSAGAGEKICIKSTGSYSKSGKKQNLVRGLG